jgi:hypothetical protein
MLIEYGVAFAIVGLLYYWGRRNRQTGWRRKQKVLYGIPVEMLDEIAADSYASSMATGLLGLNRAVDKSVSPADSPESVRSKGRT